MCLPATLPATGPRVCKLVLERTSSLSGKASFKSSTISYGQRRLRLFSFFALVHPVAIRDLAHLGCVRLPFLAADA